MSSSTEDPTAQYKLPEPPPGYGLLPWGKVWSAEAAQLWGGGLWWDAADEHALLEGSWLPWPGAISVGDRNPEHAWNCIFAVPEVIPPAPTAPPSPSARSGNRMIRVVVIREGAACDFAFHPDHVVFMQPSSGSPEMTVVTTASNGFFVVKEPFESLYNRTYLV